MAVKFELLVKGDTLLVGETKIARQVDKNTKLPIFDHGEKLVVTKTLPAGVAVKSVKTGRQSEYHFEMGGEKLDYTPETTTAIAKRAELLKSETAESKPFDAQAQIGALQGTVVEMRNLVLALQKQNTELMNRLGDGPQVQEQQQLGQQAEDGPTSEASDA